MRFKELSSCTCIICVKRSSHLSSWYPVCTAHCLSPLFGELSEWGRTLSRRVSRTEGRPICWPPTHPSFSLSPDDFPDAQSCYSFAQDPGPYFPGLPQATPPSASKQYLQHLLQYLPVLNVHSHCHCSCSLIPYVLLHTSLPSLLPLALRPKQASVSSSSLGRT